MDGFNKELLNLMCFKLDKSDREIARFFNVDRTYVTKIRAEYGIEKKPGIGRLGERYVLRKLDSKGFDVVDMNETNKLSSFDILVNDSIRIDVKTSSVINDNGKESFYFSLSDKPGNAKVVSDHAIRLSNGRIRKLYRRTCDFMIFIGVDGKKVSAFVIPSNFIADTTQGVKISTSPNYRGKYAQFRGRWGLIQSHLETKKKA